jgi:cytoskeleton protein RodZ
LSGFGERLERERTKRGVKLEQVAEATKISSRMLRALETEEFEKLPGGVFNRGFARSYARYLGLNENEIVAQYIEAAGEQEQPLPEPPPASTDDFGRWARFIALAVAVLGLVCAAWFYRGPLQTSARQLLQRRPLKSAPAVLARGPLKPEPQANTPSVTTPSLVTTAATEATTPPASTKVAEPITADGPTITPGHSTAASESVEVQNGEFVVSVRARQDAWLSISADGRDVMQGILAADSERRFRAARKLVFVTGNAGGVELSFNGEALGPLGPENRRRQVTFTPQGLQQ